jgi:2-polyprenyl-6-methoxyphenol hydroxylase-like FAD-dependent oxidoreductase
VIIVGAGPTGLMLAAELCLGGVRPLVLERRVSAEDTPRANGLPGRILELLRYRGQLERLCAAAGRQPHPAPMIPFGGLHVDMSHLADSPLQALGSGNRNSSVCSPSAPANSAPISAAGTRCSA